jgi:hypothetical protein
MNMNIGCLILRLCLNVYIRFCKIRLVCIYSFAFICCIDEIAILGTEFLRGKCCNTLIVVLRFF